MASKQVPVLVQATSPGASSASGSDLITLCFRFKRQADASYHLQQFRTPDTQTWTTLDSIHQPVIRHEFIWTTVRSQVIGSASKIIQLDVDPTLAAPFLNGTYSMCTDITGAAGDDDARHDGTASSESSSPEVPRRITTRSRTQARTTAAASGQTAPPKATAVKAAPVAKKAAAETGGISELVEAIMSMQRDNIEFMKDTIAEQHRQARMLHAEQQQQVQRLQEEQLQHSTAVIHALENIASARDRVKSQRMTITPFDGSTENAMAWLLMYERACEANGWTTDASRVNNLKSAFKQGSSAQKWFDSRIIQAPNATWDEWRSSFIDAFQMNTIDATRRVLRWEYRGGNLLDFFYEMERMLTLAYGATVVAADNHRLLINNVSAALPRDLSNQISMSAPKDKPEFVQCLQRLSAKAKTEKTTTNATAVASNKFPSSQQRPHAPHPRPDMRPNFNPFFLQQLLQQQQQQQTHQGTPLQAISPQITSGQQQALTPWQPRPSFSRPATTGPSSRALTQQQPHQQQRQWKSNSDARRVNAAQEHDVRAHLSKPAIVELPADTDTEKKHVNAIHVDVTTSLPVFYVKAEPGNLTLATLLDSGSDDNFISEAVVVKQRLPFSRAEQCFIAFNSITCKADRYVSLTITIGNRSIQAKLWVMKDLSFDMLLGYPALNALDIHLSNISQLKAVHHAHRSLSNGSIHNADQIASLFPSLLRPFRDRQTSYSVVFSVNDNIPIIQHRPYRLSPLKAAFADQKIQEMLDDGLVEQTDSPFASPCLVVDKKDDPDGTTGKMRLCTDLREVNKWCTQNPFPLPNIQDLLQRTGGAKYFSRIDLKDSFWQLPLTQDSRKYTAFVTPSHHVQYTCLPFGYRSSPQLFSKFMRSHVLRELLHDRRVGQYVDDVFVACQTEQECAKLTYVILKRYAEVGLIINLAKTQVCKPEIKLLGRTLDGRTRTTRSESREKALNSKDPHDIHTLRSFCGLLETFRERIPHFSTIMKPINELRKKGVPFHWNDECQQAKQKLMDIITSDPILCLPDWSLPFELMTDASNLGTGAVLFQRDQRESKNRQLRLIGFHSYAFNRHELSYCVAEKEALAIIKALKYFRTYLESRKFIIRTDHAALTALKSKEEPRGRLCRWMVFLMGFDYDIIHRSGSQHHDADCISRLFLPHNNEITTSQMDTRKPIQVTGGSQQHNVMSVIHVHDDNATLKYEILATYHDSTHSGGHSGRRATIAKITPRFQWKGMHRDITDYVRSCHVCQTIKFKYKRKVTYLPLPVHADTPYEAVNIDFGELSKRSDTITTTKSFLVLVDQHTRMVHVKPMKESSSAVINFFLAQDFLHLIHKIVSDNGSAFTSASFKSFCKDHNITHVTTSINNPSANSLAERQVQEVKKYVALYPYFPGGWRPCIIAAADLHNRTPSRSLGCSPLALLQGRRSSFDGDRKFNVTTSTLAPELPLSKEEQTASRSKAYTHRNQHKHIPTFAAGEQILYSNSTDRRHPAVQGPAVIDRVHTMDNHPVTLVTTDGDVVSPRNAVKYIDRRTINPSRRVLTSIITSMLILTTAMATFVQESPVLFVKSEQPVIGRWVHVRHELVFADPCHNFTNSQDIANKDHRKHLKTWCSLKYHREIIEPLFHMARDNTRYRPKRQLLSGLAVVSAVVSVVNMYSKITDNAHEIEQLQSAMNVMRLQMRNSKQHMQNIITVLKERDRMLQDHEEILRDLPEMSAMVADAAAEIAVQGAMVKNIVRSFKSKKIHPSLFDLFRVDLPPYAITDNVKAIDAWCVPSDGYLQIEYQVPFANPLVSLHEAQPFTIFAQNMSSDGSVQQCELHYTGPAYALVTPTCAYGMSVTAAQVATTAYIIQNSTTCRITPAHEQHRYWIIHRCTVPYQPPAQMKFSTTDAFIYCPQWNITLSNVTIPCPDTVFRVPVSTSFKIGDISHNGDYRMVLHRNVSLTDNIVILHHIYDRGTHESFQFKQDLAQTESEIISDVTALDNMSFITKHNNVYSITVTVICLGFTAYHVIKCYLLYRRSTCIKASPGTARTETPAIELHPIRVKKAHRAKNMVVSDDDEDDD